MKIGSLFTGIGGIDLAFMCAGFGVEWQVEIDPFCQQVLQKNFPDVQRHLDIFDCKDLPYVDVICAGFPCQPFSVAGKRQGRNDERFLVPEMIRIINEIKPVVIFLENVLGFASLNDGDEFKELLGTLACMGYDAEWGHLRASDAGAPHQRERWFFVGYRRELSDPKSFGYERNGGHWHKKSYSRFGARKIGRGCYSRYKKAAPIKPGLGGASNGVPYRVDRHQFPAPRNVPQYDWEPERVTDRKDNRRERIKALGNAVVPQVIYPIALSIFEYLEGVKS